MFRFFLDTFLTFLALMLLWSFVGELLTAPDTIYNIVGILVAALGLAGIFSYLGWRMLQ